MAPESIKVDTENQAAITDKMVSSPMEEEHKVEEKEDGCSDSDRRYKYVPEPEPEWDVDSYDGREYELRNQIPKIVSFSLMKTIIKNTVSVSAGLSRGFLPEPLSGIYPIQDLEEIAYRNMTALMTNLANLCVKKLNEEKGKTVELVEIVRVIEAGGARWNSYITFMAREYPNGPLVEYQAKVMNYAGNEKPP